MIRRRLSSVIPTDPVGCDPTPDRQQSASIVHRDESFILGDWAAAMLNIAEQLETLRRRIGELNKPNTQVEYLQRLAVTQTGDVFNLDFYGGCYQGGYSDLLSTLVKPEIAASIRSLILRGPDEGANGTNDWNIKWLFDTDTTFPRRKHFRSDCKHRETITDRSSGTISRRMGFWRNFSPNHHNCEN
jgi:hypothetical protein